MKRLMTMVVLLVLAWALPLHAGPVMGGGEASEGTLADLPDTKPVRCIGPINMSNGLVLPKGKYSASVKYRYVHKDGLYNGSTKMNGDYNGKYDRVNQSLQFTVKAGLFEDFEARMMVPFWDKRVKRKAGVTPTSYAADEVTGLGDVVVMGRYALMSQRKGDWASLAFGAGLKLPTGDADHENDPPFAAQNKYLGPGGQLGTGSWDPKFELGLTKIVDRTRYDAHFMYTIAGDGAHGSRMGNQFKYDFGCGYALSRSFDVEIELNGVDQKRNWFNHTAEDSSGGHTIYITPGVHWKITDSAHFSVGVPVVVYRYLNGYSATPDRNSRYGLGEDFQVVTRIGFSF
ncbi:MAG: transporter [Pseudodesulfovibrio sp.]